MSVDGSVSWSVSQGKVTRLSLYGGFNYWLLTGCNTSSVTINGFFNHDCGGYSWHFSVWACK